MAATGVFHPCRGVRHVLDPGRVYWRLPSMDQRSRALVLGRPCGRGHGPCALPELVVPSTFHRGDHAARNCTSSTLCGVCHRSPRRHRLEFGAGYPALPKRLVRGRRHAFFLREHDRGDLLRRMGSSRNRAFPMSHHLFLRPTSSRQSRGALAWDRIPSDGRSSDTGAWRARWEREEHRGDSIRYVCISPTTPTYISLLSAILACPPKLMPVPFYSPACLLHSDPRHTPTPPTTPLHTYSLPPSP